MRIALPSFAASLALAISACAPGDDPGKGGEGERAPGSSFGYELAVGDTVNPDQVEPAVSVIDLTAAELAEKIATGNVRLIDVRTAEEVAAGIIPGAEHLPLDSFDPALLSGDDTREIVLYCRSGRRSGIAGQALSEHRGEPAQHLAGGILAWQEAGFETVEPAE